MIRTSILSIAVALALVPGRIASAANNGPGEKTKFCSKTAKLLFDACGHSVSDDHLVTRAICLNVSDESKRAACVADAKDARDEGDQLCRGQRDTRRAACKALGEARYDPPFDPADFDDDFTNLTHPNPYFPLAIGDKWEFHGGSDVNTVEVVNETKLIEGVRCITIKDQVFRAGDLHEDTNDWYCQAKNGDVRYVGEETKDYESFDGDSPRLPELVSIDGSFKHGREGDKGGLIFLASPHKGDVYLEEFSLGNAEDVTEILSTTYAFGNGEGLDDSVPQALAQLLCSGGDCIVTKNYSLLEPGLFARKYYAKGIGVFLEVENVGDVVQLVSCDLIPADLRCGMLPPAP